MYYLVSLAFNKLRYKSKWWTTGISKQVILGALPLQSSNHASILTHHPYNVTAVLSIVEDFELEPSIVAEPVASTLWSKLGVSQKIINVEDMTPLTQDQLKESSKFIKDQINQGQNVYVHCKAGRGRSVMAVMAYLIDHHGLSSSNAYTKIKEKRPHVHLLKKQWISINQYYENQHAR